MTTDNGIPSDFLWRRLHSISGVLLVVFIIFHLLTNSMAAFPIGGDGLDFIHSVNAIHDTPYLIVVEIAILALPIFIHMVWGIKYLFTASYNSFGNTGHTPYLPEYPRNHAYTWQRITSWILIFGIIAHVVHMRFLEYPISAVKGYERYYMVRVSEDSGLSALAERLGVKIYNNESIHQLKDNSIGAHPEPLISAGEPQPLTEIRADEQDHDWEAALQKQPLRSGEVVAVANTFGAAELLMVRDTFKMPVMLALYSLFVLATCFHAFNGLWTFMITWGVTLTERSQRLMRHLTTALMVVVTFLGLSAIWVTYWINLKG